MGSRQLAYQCTAVGLVNLSVRLLGVHTFSVFPEHAFQAPLIVVGFCEVQLRTCVSSSEFHDNLIKASRAISTADSPYRRLSR